MHAQPCHAMRFALPAQAVGKQATVADTAEPAQLFLGQFLKLVGSAPGLGEWDFRAAPAFEWTEDHVWQLELELPVDTPVDWKVVQAVEGNDEWCEWQAGENTIIDPAALALKPGDVLQVGCSWDGPSRATIVVESAANTAATAADIASQEDAGDRSASAIASVAHSVSQGTAPAAAVEVTDNARPHKARRGFSLFNWAMPGAVPTPIPQPVEATSWGRPAPSPVQQAPTDAPPKPAEAPVPEPAAGAVPQPAEAPPAPQTPPQAAPHPSGAQAAVPETATADNAPPQPAAQSLAAPEQPPALPKALTVSPWASADSVDASASADAPAAAGPEPKQAQPAPVSAEQGPSDAVPPSLAEANQGTLHPPV
jgi:Starch binding domain